MIDHLSHLRTGALAAALLACSSLSALAATVTFDFTASGGTVSGSGYSNQRVYSAGGVTLTVTGWSTTGAGGQLDRANVGQYGGAGLGVCSTADGGSSCSSPDHQVDNFGAQEFVLFQFSVPVDPTSVTINPYGTYDRDVRYYVNSGALTLATVDASLPSAIGTEFNDPSTVSSSARTVAIGGSTSVQTLLFGGPTLGLWSWSTPDNDKDFFKIENLVVNFTPPPSGGPEVPAPGALALFGAALAGLAVTRRRPA